LPFVPRNTFALQLRDRTLRLGERTLVMGILNVTPDSFSERGRYFDRRAAIARGLEMEREGAAILDIGGESTRPGAEPVAEEEELDRTIPVIEALRHKGLKIPVSIDTYKAAVAERALRAGAEIVNDVSGLRYDERLADVVRTRRAAIVLMHLRGTPQTMQQLTPVRNIVATVRTGLVTSLRRALAAGISRRRIVLDPGIGFGKTAQQNFELIRALPRLARLGYPLLVGPSRKSFIRRTLEDLPDTSSAAAKESGASDKRRLSGIRAPLEVSEKVLFGTAAAVTACVFSGAHIVRVHDVRQMLPSVFLADRFIAS
jgi:dihydropteroate synthase